MFQKTNKYIKYTYQKKNLLKKVSFNSQNQNLTKFQNYHKSKNLCFLDQGMENTDLMHLKIGLNRIGVQMNKIPLRLWSKVEWNLNIEKKDKKKKHSYGNLFILSNENKIPKKATSHNLQQYKENFWIQYIYNHNLSYLNYQNNTRITRVKGNKDSNRFVESTFKFSNPQNSVNLLSKNLFQDSHKEKPMIIDKSSKLSLTTQIILPWDVISSEAEKSNKISENTCQQKWNKSENFENNDQINIIDKSIIPNFAGEWNDLDGHPVENLINHVSTNQLSFIGILHSQNENCPKILLDNPNIYDWVPKNQTKKIDLYNWSAHYYDTNIDLAYIKIPTLSSSTLTYL